MFDERADDEKGRKEKKKLFLLYYDGTVISGVLFYSRVCIGKHVLCDSIISSGRLYESSTRL